MTSTAEHSTTRAPRVSPTPRRAVLVFLGYLLVFYGVWVITGIKYEHIGDDASTLLRWYVAPLAAAAVYLIVVVGWLGWWRPVLREELRGPRWAAIPAVLLVLLAGSILLSKSYSSTTTMMFLYGVLGSIGVGFGEEVAARGVLLTGFRSAMTERRAWWWSTLLFGLMHLPNWFFGLGPSAIAQVGTAFIGGCTFYLMRRATGGLVAAMVVHGIWDFATFVGKGAAGLSMMAVGINLLALVLAIFVARRAASLAPAAA